MKLRNNYFEHPYHSTKEIYFKFQKGQNSGKGKVKIRQVFLCDWKADFL